MVTKQNATDKMTDRAMQEAAKKIEFVFDALVAHAEPTAKIPEEVFIHHFLPYFSGEKPMTKESKVMENWVSISGTPTNEVAVLDKTGKELYRVPPVFDTNILDVTSRNLGESMSDIYAGFAMRKNNLPAIANTFLANSLENRLSTLVDAGEASPNQKRWSEIISRYQKPNTNALTPKSIQPAKALPDDDLVYD